MTSSSSKFQALWGKPRTDLLPCLPQGRSYMMGLLLCTRMSFALLVMNLFLDMNANTINVQRLAL